VVEDFPSNFEALSSNPSTDKKKCGGGMNIQGILLPVLELLPIKVKKLKDYAPQK
jgi:hypothetical protein